MNHPKSTVRPQRRAFTLLELVTVVAVVAILSALLFAVVQKAMESARNVKCVGNLRALGSAIFAYAGDNNNMLLPRVLSYYRPPEEQEQPGNMRVWPNRLLKLGYVSNPDIFYCPSFFPRNNHESTTPLPANNSPRTYGIRTWVTPGT